jgi:hypothetical protein
MIHIKHKTITVQMEELHKMYTEYVDTHNIHEFDTFRQKHLLFARLKGAHISKRNSALRMIFYLAQQKGYCRCLLTCTVKNSKLRDTYHAIHKSRFTDKTKDVIIRACNRYIKNCTVVFANEDNINNKHIRYYLTHHKSFKILKISYNPEDINWSLIEYDLLTQHKNNIYINAKNHGVYITKY